MTAIYFDTNALIEGNWPRLSGRLQEVLDLAFSLKKEVFLPELVLDEAKAHFVRKMEEQFSELERSGDGINLCQSVAIRFAY